MKTQEEILAKLKEVLNHLNGLFDFRPEVLAGYLRFEQLEPLGLLEKGVTQESWAAVASPPTRKAVIGELEGYLEFAIGKAEGERGLSAMRSIQKLEIWVWMLDEPELYRDFEEAGYEPYGMPKLQVLKAWLEAQVPA